MQFDRFEVLPEERRLIVDGKVASIGARAFDVLMALIERRDRVVTKNELLELVWPHLVVEENNLQVHVSALRKVLGNEVIATIPGRGYRFVAAGGMPSAAGVAAREAARGAAGQGNLPERLPALYGRDADLATVLALVDEHPLVTIVGAGGIGKTSLAQAAAHARRSHYGHGAWVVELASLNDPSLVLPTIAQTLRIALPPQGDPERALLQVLRSQQLLLVLDNCEHVLGAVSRFVFDVVRQAPGVRLLATSQECLRLPEEQQLRLSALAVPAQGDAGRAAEFGAVQLFVERVKAVQAGFALDAHNVEAVIDVCARLDGIALAIELAAARVPVLGVGGLRDRLHERFRVLTGGARVSLRRHQTLRAALDWSHQLLGEAERTVFRRLGVFAGGFTMEAAQSVASDESLDEWAVLDHVGALVDKSLVLADDGVHPRYRLLETARAYAMEQLAEAGETDEWLRRHALSTERLFERAVKRRDSDVLALEMNNMRAAFAWASGPRGDPQVAIALATHSAMVLAVEGMVVEALQRLLKVEPLVGDATPPALAAQFWQWLGRVGIDGRLPVSRCIESLRRSGAMFRAQGNGRHLHACLRMRAEAMLELGEFRAADSALAEARAMEHDPWPVADRMRRLRVQAMLEERTGRATESLATAEQAYRMAEAEGIDRYVLILLSDMAHVHLKMGHAERAAEQFMALAAKARARPTDGLTLCYALAGLTAALVAQERLEQAHSVALEAVPLLRRSGILLARADIFAWLMACSGEIAAAAKLVGAADAYHQRSESSRNDVELRMRQDSLHLLQQVESSAQIERWRREGAAMDEDALALLIE